MGEAKRHSPDPMPSDARADEAAMKPPRRLFVAGARGTKRTKDPVPEVHMSFRTAGAPPPPAQVKDRHAIIFVHGYNVSAAQSLDSAAHFFQRLQAAQQRDGHDLERFLYVLFTWPGDTGPLWFGDAQKFAQHAGVALYQFARQLRDDQGAADVSLVTHSLGAHVGLRSCSILGERRFSGRTTTRYRNVLLLAPAVEDDVFHRPKLLEEYHFPDSPFGMTSLQMFASRADDVLKGAYLISEADKALGFAGPESMTPLQSLARRVEELMPGETFRFRLHDFSPSSTTIINPALHAHHHSDYWNRDEQADYYVNFLA
jgi:hypothetical protein